MKIGRFFVAVVVIVIDEKRKNISPPYGLVGGRENATTIVIRKGTSTSKKSQVQEVEESRPSGV